MSEPNPALHLTPPADSGRTASCIMAVQVSFMFGRHRVHDRAGGGAGRVVRMGELRVSGSA
ncbi:hypothetical protein [Gemmata obscuriglobus]|uniref:hypothetical protein n=1 Tax=Gemmata obscuriglobus TaxID=114 RepID=UPI0018D7B5A7|nr:hypothetical protein [Gemmata obscuriglobus]